MIVYATQYALTRGIEKLEIKRALFAGSRYIYCCGSSYRKSHLFESLADAMAHAEEMREKKIAKLRDLEIKVIERV